ncbi:DNA recombination protein RmuC [Entomoplasma freundtii]|uniref:DNA recombination protein n=2 Tax=Entomoplasma freundtii TaxID=74700 RepID=A0A2K8NS65_9MOLU|nr:DNA recombination protein RmuC [Entomoplasma freundtii]ATZ16680.1 DNA recombination protein [Entomoplasma freundtii]TDY58153.1 DNA recombination protein RmuC [Entomoplasma freundtii]
MIGIYVLSGLILAALLILLFIMIRNNKQQDKRTLDQQPLALPNLEGMAKVDDIIHSKELLSTKIESVNQALNDYKKDLKESIKDLDKNANDSNIKTSEHLGGLLAKVETLQDDLNGKNGLLTNYLHSQRTQMENSFGDVKKSLATLNEASQGLQRGLMANNTGLTTNLNQQQLKMDTAFENVLKSLTVLNETSQGIKTIEGSVQTLQNIFLNNNKARGNLGEYVLEKLLNDVYGANQDLWELQVTLPNQTIVDALVKTGTDKENIAIDSKFPLTNYNNYVMATDKQSQERYLSAFAHDFKERIKEATKFITPKNNISSVIMFVPSEDIFSFVIANFQDEIVQYAMKNKVWITSPTTLAATLFIIDKHLQEGKLNANLDKVKANLLAMKKELDRWNTRWGALNKDINKVFGDAKDLNITTDKIYNKYEKIYKDQSAQILVENID